MGLSKKEHAALYRQRHREIINEKARLAWAKDPDHSRNKKRASRYNLTLDQVKFLMNKACCDCCGALEHGNGSKGWCVDHDHLTGLVRGLLCKKCNNKLGLVAESLEELEANYLQIKHYLEIKAKITQSALDSIKSRS